MCAELLVWNFFGRFPEVSGIIIRLPPICTHTLLALVTRKDCVQVCTSPKEDCVRG